MQSNNPVFRRSAEFNGSAANAHGQQTYAGGAGYGYNQGQYGNGDPSTWDMSRATGPGSTPTRRMTIDSVVQSAAITLGVVILSALATWIVIGDVATNVGASRAMMLAFVGSIAAFGLSLVNSFKRVVSPALVLVFAVAEGVAMGALSKVFDSFAGGGVVTGAVIGTFAAFAGTLAAYKVLNIQVGDKFRKFVVAAMFGMLGLGLMELLLSAFGAELGLFGFGGLGILFAVAGLVLGVFMLILDFDYVEQGIRFGIDERESWRAAFAMTVSLVWIYTNLLRLLAIFSQD